MGGAGPTGVTYDLASGAARLHARDPARRGRRRLRRRATAPPSSAWWTRSSRPASDPRRFTEDLLRRLRDLVIVAAVPDAPATGLLDVPQDAGERLVAQAARFGSVELSRAADIVAAGLTEMRGATAPRLLLELICARVLLPGADDTSDGVMARLDRIERRLDVSGAVSAADRRRPALRSRPAARRADPARPGSPAARPLRPPGCPGSSRPGRLQAPAGADAAPRSSTASTSRCTRRRASTHGPGRRARRRASPTGRGAERRSRPRSTAGEPARRGVGSPRRRRRRDRGREQPQPRRRTPPVARHRGRDQGPAARDLDPPHPERPGRSPWTRRR